MSSAGQESMEVYINDGAVKLGETYSKEEIAGVIAEFKRTDTETSLNEGDNLESEAKAWLSLYKKWRSLHKEVIQAGEALAESPLLVDKLVGFMQELERRANNDLVKIDHYIELFYDRVVQILNSHQIWPTDASGEMQRKQSPAEILEPDVRLLQRIFRAVITDLSGEKKLVERIISANLVNNQLFIEGAGSEYYPETINFQDKESLLAAFKMIVDEMNKFEVNTAELLPKLCIKAHEMAAGRSSTNTHS